MIFSRIIAKTVHPEAWILHWSHPFKRLVKRKADGNIIIIMFLMLKSIHDHVRQKLEG